MADHTALLQDYNFSDLIQVATQGSTGGIVLLWHSNELTVNPATVTSQEIHAAVQVCPRSNPWLISVVYTSTNYSNRKILWNNLKEFNQHHHFAWLLCGDFNEVSSSAEKFGGNHINIRRSNTFNNCLNSLGMIDLGFAGSRFTWINKPKLHNNINSSKFLIMECLDKFLANDKWIHLFEDSTVQHLPHTHSDHCPIILNLTKPFSKPTPTFRLETMWLQHPDFLNIVNSTWLNKPQYFHNLDQFTNLATTWTIQTFGNIFYKKKDYYCQTKRFTKYGSPRQKLFSLQLIRKLPHY